jgi:hypothetical protein
MPATECARRELRRALRRRGAELMPWSSQLERPLEIPDGRVLRNLADVSKFIESLPADVRRSEPWLHVYRLTAIAAHGENTLLLVVVTDRVAEALESTAIDKKPP